jgi:hypothetical protein
MIEIPQEFELPRTAFVRQRSLLCAHVAAPQARSTRRRAALVVALAVALGVLLVAPAFGIGGRFLDLIQGTPAPPQVETHFAANNQLRASLFAFAEEAGHELHDRFSPVIASEARGLFALETVDGPIYLWVAPTEDGRQCWLIQWGEAPATGRPYGNGSCDSTEEPRTIGTSLGWAAERPSVRIVHARLYDDSITRVDVEFEDASVLRLPVVAGHALGTVPNEPVPIVAFVGRDESGEEVARAPLRDKRR